MYNKKGSTKYMNEYLTLTKISVFEKCGLTITEFKAENESKEYAACRFKLNGLKVVCRKSKITPKKVGQFVTFWKRNKNGITEPLDETDLIDFYVINVKEENYFGQFVFPKSILIEKGLISTPKREGKRGFRIYPRWDRPQSRQAINTQKWQLNYFFEINDKTDLERVVELYRLN